MNFKKSNGSRDELNPEKLVDLNLRRMIFNHKITSFERRILTLGVEPLEEIDNEELKFILSTTDPDYQRSEVRLIICLLSSKMKCNKNKLIKTCLEELKISPSAIITASIATANLDVAKKVLELYPDIELKKIIKIDHYLLNLMAIGKSDDFLEVLNFPTANSLTLKDELQSDDYNEIYRHACRCGQLEILKYIESISLFDPLEAINDRGCIAYSDACMGGHLDVLLHLESIKGFDASKVVQQNIETIFGTASFNNRVKILQHLQSIPELNLLKEATSIYYDAYRNACKKGFYGVILFLESIAGFDILRAASESDYAAFQGACENGHLTILQHLESISGFNRLKAAKSKDFQAYRTACGKGNLSILQYLESIIGFNVLRAVKAKNYDAYRSACSNGQVAVLKHLESIPGFNKLEAASYYDYRFHYILIPYANACSNGHLAILKHLESIEGFNTLQAASNRAYRLACKNGHLDIVKHLESIEGFETLKAAISNDYTAYIEACSQGHLSIVLHLESIEGFDTHKNFIAKKIINLFSGDNNLNTEIINHLLGFINVLSYTEKNDKEFGKKFVYSFVTMYLRIIKEEKKIFEKTNPNDLFNIDNDKAKYCFYLLRNLIRRGVDRTYSEYSTEETREAEDLSHDICFLLSIPAVRQLCHQKITVDENSPGTENELLRLSLRIKNFQAASLLMLLPNVRQLAESNNFYHHERRGSIDWQAIEQARESSMITSNKYALFSPKLNCPNGLIQSTPCSFP